MTEPEECTISFKAVSDGSGGLVWTELQQKCDISGCTNPAYADIRWGKLPGQVATLCQQHVQELWQQAKPTVATGQSFWIQDEPGTLRGAGNGLPD